MRMGREAAGSAYDMIGLDWIGFRNADSWTSTAKRNRKRRRNKSQLALGSHTT